MAATNFAYVFGQLIGHEGKLSVDPADRGNWTSGTIGKGEICGSKFGVTGQTLGAYRRLGRSATLAEMKKLGIGEAKLIFRKQYWNAVQADNLPFGVDYAMSDFAYNSGPGHAIPAMQKILKVGVDGSVGEKTLAAIAQQDAVALIHRYCDARLAFLRKTYGWKRYSKGWTRRVGEVRAASVGLARVVNLPDVPRPIAPEGAEASQRIDPKKTPEGQAKIGAAIGAAGTAAADAADKIAPHIATFEALKWVFLGLTLVSIGIGVYLYLKQLKAAEA